MSRLIIYNIPVFSVIHGSFVLNYDMTIVVLDDLCPHRATLSLTVKFRIGTTVLPLSGNVRRRQ